MNQAFCEKLAELAVAQQEFQKIAADGARGALAELAPYLLSTAGGGVLGGLGGYLSNPGSDQVDKRIRNSALIGALLGLGGYGTYRGITKTPTPASVEEASRRRMPSLDTKAVAVGPDGRELPGQRTFTLNDLGSQSNFAKIRDFGTHFLNQSPAQQTGRVIADIVGGVVGHRVGGLYNAPRAISKEHLNTALRTQGDGIHSLWGQDATLKGGGKGGKGGGAGDPVDGDAGVRGGGVTQGNISKGFGIRTQEEADVGARAIDRRLAEGQERRWFQRRGVSQDQRVQTMTRAVHDLRNMTPEEQAVANARRALGVPADPPAARTTFPNGRGGTVHTGPGGTELAGPPLRNAEAHNAALRNNRAFLKDLNKRIGPAPGIWGRVRRGGGAFLGAAAMDYAGRNLPIMQPTDYSKDLRILNWRSSGALDRPVDLPVEIPSELQQFVETGAVQ